MAVHTTGNKSTVASIPPHWEKAEDVYTSNDLIQAYLDGRQFERDQRDRVLYNELRKNVDHAADLAVNLMDQVSKESIKLKEAHLKIEGIGKFTALLVADKDDFVSDKFKKAYDTALKLKHSSLTDTFYITFSFMPASDKINSDCLASEGFVLKYEKK